MKSLSKNLHAYNEIMQAYSDCNDNSGERNLNYFCNTPLTAEELIALMPKCIPDGYNNFDPVKTIEYVVETFGNKAQYHVAREGSVCIYIKAGPGNLWLGTGDEKEMNADEFIFDGDRQMFRVWWD